MAPPAKRPRKRKPKWRRRVVLGIGLSMLVVGLGALLLVKHYMDVPMFEPGTVAVLVREAGESLDPPPQPEGADGRWRVTPDVSLHHVSSGSGEDLLLVHGGPGYPPREPWKVTSELARAYRVHTYHQRGCGESTRPFDRPPPGRFYDKLRAVESKLGLGAQIADIERIRRILGKEKIVLIGHSFGGLIAALYAAEFPQGVRALVLVAPAPLQVMPKDGPDLFTLVRDRLPASQREEYARYFAGYFDFRTLLRRDEASLSRYFGAFREFYAAAISAPVPENEGDAGGFMTLGVYASLGRKHDWREVFGRIRAPTLVVHGADDLQPEADTRSVALAIPGARMEVIPHSGHFVPDDAPQPLARLVLAFLASNATASR